MTSPTASTNSPSTSPSNVGAGGQIQASTFQQMLQILDDLTDHTHTVYDDYTAVCECQCQCACACGRGSI
jgi:hypothetical protein